MFVLSDLIDARSLEALAQSVRSTLSNIAAQVQTAWTKQHGRDGAHGMVTAVNVRAGQIGLAGAAPANAALSLSLAPLVVPANVTLVQVETGNTGSFVEVYGIQQDGAQHGDILALSTKRSGGVDNLRLTRLSNVFAVPVPAGTEIAWDTFIYASNTLVVSSASWRSPLLLMYLPEAGSAGASAWCALHAVAL